MGDGFEFPVFGQAEPLRIPIAENGVPGVRPAPPPSHPPEPFEETLDTKPLRWDLTTGRPFRLDDGPPLGHTIAASAMMGVSGGFLLTFVVGVLLKALSLS